MHINIMITNVLDYIVNIIQNILLCLLYLLNYNNFVLLHLITIHYDLLIVFYLMIYLIFVVFLYFAMFLLLFVNNYVDVDA
jgi:hypothetical protein